MLSAFPCIILSTSHGCPYESCSGRLTTIYSLYLILISSPPPSVIFETPLHHFSYFTTTFHHPFVSYSLHASFWVCSLCTCARSADISLCLHLDSLVRPRPICLATEGQSVLPCIVHEVVRLALALAPPCSTSSVDLRVHSVASPFTLHHCSSCTHTVAEQQPRSRVRWLHLSGRDSYISPRKDNPCCPVPSRS